ncbi:4-diphosphocytidyl-2-C-methyl-D-erythritol kinase, putative [Perkinsus marinus ATCC 50983]|uniref:4-diphosphocytidyl-2-C-methyl-D-erythritol kinase, putative n=1 Tax=Perkinsus marinus (strain ATCC 50983 / TXsc) TaxID=423536 RepID=C5L3L8_PERM5|nr:4-diphosphocytidyl-2-C-methyl-D-erythritol kinase, putative [Perkinsus marinus ATCC 50983]EER08597.1 4-diphosphocytidyl-2-C-methyl-D-erythritol kinase, putative [Perkinsus marinus ATCC 50983]|eukprot:XP_002776781.1 4-diphosphocytidyl-2-C-methyl-D-erythritol kinase, putative [Perkinsus marinus ATCC 50983]
MVPAAATVGITVLVGAVVRRAGMKLFSPAKVNTFLKITGRTNPPNPMHTMVSQFHTISLGDWVHISTTDDSKDTLRCDDPSVPTDERNLVLRALDLFRRKSGIDQHFHVTLTKRCPNQAGLGGGSSNGATVLWAANRLTHFGATDDTLAEWSRELGSDLPFFLASRGAALCCGVGDEVLPMSPEAVGGSKGMVFVKPSFGLPTPAVYKEYMSGAGPAPLPLNDLTRGALKIRPELAQLARDMEGVMGLSGVSMSGSGSCLFGYGDPRNVDEFKAKYPGTTVWSDIVPVFRKSDGWYGGGDASSSV